MGSQENKSGHFALQRINYGHSQQAPLRPVLVTSFVFESSRTNRRDYHILTPGFHVGS